MMQIGQFVIDIIVVYYCTYMGFRTGASLERLQESNCYGDMNAAYFGASLLTSYLFLFIQFFGRTYPKKESITEIKKSQ